MLFANFMKNRHYQKEEPTVNFNVKINLRTAFIDRRIGEIIEKIKSDTKDIPHVNINFHIS